MKDKTTAELEARVAQIEGMLRGMARTSRYYELEAEWRQLIGEIKARNEWKTR